MSTTSWARKSWYMYSQLLAHNCPRKLDVAQVLHICHVWLQPSREDDNDHLTFQSKSGDRPQHTKYAALLLVGANRALQWILYHQSSKGMSAAGIGFPFPTCVCDAVYRC